VSLAAFKAKRKVVYAALPLTTLACGAFRSIGRPSRGAGRCCRRAEWSTAGTRTATLLGGLTAQLWGGKVEASFCKNRDSGGLVLIRGAAAGIGREVESTGVFGWATGDRLRQVWLILIIKLLGGGRASDLTTD